MSGGQEVSVRPDLGSEVNEKLLKLNDSVWEAVADCEDKIGSQHPNIPDYVPAKEMVSESRFSKDFLVLHQLGRALELAKAGPFYPLVQMFEEICPYLQWSQNPNYTEANCDRSFLDGYAYAAFSGPQGPIHLDAPRGGFMLMGPNVFYRDHHHEPEEVYLVLTPGAQWRLDQGEWFDVAAGDLILHKKWQMHAIRTGTEPLLAFAGWTEVGSRLGIDFSKR